MSFIDQAFKYRIIILFHKILPNQLNYH
jgi:hypothetical protein